MFMITLLGLFAATCTTLSFLPQVIKAIKTKKTKDISLATYLLLFIGVLSWLGYGIFTHDLPLMLANIITFIFVLVIIFFKIKHG